MLQVWLSGTTYDGDDNGVKKVYEKIKEVMRYIKWEKILIGMLLLVTDLKVES